MGSAERTMKRTGAGAGVAVLLVIWVFSVPMLAFEGWLKQLSWMGSEPVDPGRGRLLTTIAAVLLVLLPALALFLAHWAGSRGLAGVLLVLTLGAALLALLIVVSAHSGKRVEPADQPREPPHCVTLSGGVNTCPGG